MTLASSLATTINRAAMVAHKARQAAQIRQMMREGMTYDRPWPDLLAADNAKLLEQLDRAAIFWAEDWGVPPEGD